MTTVMDRLDAYYRALNDANPLGPEHWVRPSRNEVVQVCYLDTSGVDLALLVPGAVHLVVADRLGDAPGDWPQVVVDLVEKRPDGSDADLDCHQLRNGSRAGHVVIELLKAKAPQLLFAKFDDVLDPRVEALVQRTWHCEVDADMVGRVAAHAWPGEPYVGDHDGDLQALSLTDVLVAARSAASGADFRWRLSGGAGTADAVVPPADAPVAAAPQPARGVTPLSEMSGFGPAKEWGLRLAADLRAYEDKAIPWDDVDKGVLLSSPPGCGKSTFARALAEECGVPLHVTTYTDWAGAESKWGGDTIQKSLSKLFA